MSEIRDVIAALNREFGDDWSFDLRRHHRLGSAVEVVGELRANGTRASETGTANSNATLSLGEQLSAAADDCLRKCAAVVLEGEVAPSRPASTPARTASPQSAPAPTAVPAPATARPASTTPAPPTVPPVSAASAAGAVSRSSAYDYEQLDPVTLRVVGGAFHAIAKEMAHVLYRMSYSSIIRESEDLGCGIFDPDGLELCESESTPMHIGSLPWYIRGMKQRIGDDVYEGDIIIHNHPYYGASHTPDLAVLMPIFRDGKMLGYSGCTAHLLDVGGAAPGINVDVVDVFAEAKLFNAIKLYDRGVRNEAIWQMLKDNVRTPDMDASDIEAMIASVNLGRERFIKLVDKYGEDTVMGSAYYWMDYSERMLRAEIEKLPDGEYHADGWLDDDGKNRDVPLKVNVTVRIQGSDITIDLTGSADEVETGFNVPFEGSLVVSCNYIVRTLLLDEVAFEEFVPQNEGIFRPVHVVAPKGSIFNPNFPRACFSRFAQIQRVLDCVIQALAPIMPEKATGGNSASLYFISYSGFVAEKQQYWIYLEVDEGSYGGRYGKDGMDSVDNLMANTRNNPVEELDMHYPIRNERYELRPDPAGAGTWRGGIGIVRENRFLSAGYISCEADRHLEAPVGMFGGQEGRTGSIIKNPSTAKEENWPAKVTGAKMDAGDLIRITTPSAGGYGNPRERNPEMVLDDYLDDYMTLEIARDIYRVAIDPGSEAIDQGETRRLRAS